MQNAQLISDDAMIATIAQPRRQGGVWLTQSTSHIALSATEFDRLVKLMGEARDDTRAVTPAKARIMRYPFTPSTEHADQGT